MWRCGEPKTGVGRRTQRGAQACPEGAGEARVAVLDGRCVAEQRRDKLHAFLSAVAVLKVGTGHTARAESRGWSGRRAARGRRGL